MKKFAKRSTGGTTSFWLTLAKKLLVERTWQLAASVILPVVIGLWLDSFFHTFPGLLIAGIVAAALAVTVLALRNIKLAG